MLDDNSYTIRDFHEDTAGVLSIGIVTPIELSRLIIRHEGIAAGVIDWLDRIEQTQPLCATCDTVFTRNLKPTLWLIAQAVGNYEARGIMVMGACRRCCERYSRAEALLSAVGEQLRRSAWPDLRRLDPAQFGSGGRA